ncbi:MAG: helix-turn-helix transcriptional regulator, partial [Planctomycetes bacterium]|nr:helix-turn-helix transcriptional regulator [Planctomycetota bacterium]MCG2683237.1 helix-turn-helix transcriptional regulator [Planctomycetales bacterium]
SVVNAHYKLRAFKVLIACCKAGKEDFPGVFEYLCNNKSGRESRIKRAILYEIGRIDDDERLVYAAARICAARSKTAEAVAWLRFYRLTGTSGGSGGEGEKIGKGWLTQNQLVDRITGMTKKQAKQFSDEIRAAVQNCGKTRYRIAKQTGIDAATLCRFVQGQVGLSMDSLDKLAACIGIRLVVQKSRRTNNSSSKQKGKSK